LPELGDELPPPALAVLVRTTEGDDPLRVIDVLLCLPGGRQRYKVGLVDIGNDSPLSAMIVDKSTQKAVGEWRRHSTIPTVEVAREKELLTDARKDEDSCPFRFDRWGLCYDLGQYW
jgi:hypothetical protein